MARKKEKIIKHKDDIMDLMDWKGVERESLASIRNALIQTTISQILLEQARDKIIYLGGKTSEQEEREAREQRERNPEFNV